MPEKPRSVRGRVYELGPHRLMCGDATNPADVAALVAGHAAQAVWTDPPYGVEYVGKTAKALTIANDAAAGLQALLTAGFQAADPVLEPGAPFYVAAPAGPRGTDFRSALSAVGWTFHQTLIWVKDAMVLGHSDYHYRHEDVLYGWKPGPGRSGRGRHKGSRWYGDNAQTTVFEVARPKRSAEHPTMKPVELIAPMLANSTRPGDTVYDPFAGSGSTLIAADGLQRRAFLMELDPGYCDVIRDRWHAWNTESGATT